jgi:hypothetical protein
MFHYCTFIFQYSFLAIYISRKKERLLETWSKQCKKRRKDDDANKMPRQDLLSPKKTSGARRENNLVRTNVERVVSLQSRRR